MSGSCQQETLALQKSWERVRHKTSRLFGRIVPFWTGTAIVCDRSVRGAATGRPLDDQTSQRAVAEVGQYA